MSNKHVWTEDEDGTLRDRGFTRVLRLRCDTLGRVYFATHESDPDKPWVVKSVSKDSLEIEAVQKLSAIVSPKNHTVPAELLECPDSWIIVMPGFYQLRWDDFFSMDHRTFFRVLRWIAEGLEFMHENNVAHMDVSDSNIVTSERLDTSQHAASPSATIYYIDFEATRILPSGPGTGIRINDFYSAGGGKYIPPEGVDALDPYAYDIYCLGVLYDAIFRFTSESQDAQVRMSRCMFGFSDMLREKNPAHRPSIFRVKRLLRALQAWVFVTNWLNCLGRASYVYVALPLRELAEKADDDDDIATH